LFNGADIAAFETGDIRVKVRLSRNGEIMTAALRALRGGIENCKVLTTFTSYGEVPTERQAEIVRSLKARKADTGNESKLMAELAAVVSRHLGA
jgi:hypothetical protein